MPQFFPLEPAVAPAFAPLLHPHYRPLLLNHPEKLVAVGAVDGFTPVGVGLAALSHDRLSARVIDLQVTPSRQRQGIGTELLQVLETRLINVGCLRADLLYLSRITAAEALQRLLHKADWALSGMHLMCEGSFAHTYPTSAANGVEVTLPDGYAMALWADVPEAARSALRMKHEQTPGGWYAADVAPEVMRQIEPLNSLVMTFEGEIIGWMLNEAKGDQHIFYGVIFVDETHRGKKLALALFLRSLAIQYDHFRATGKYEFGYGCTAPGGKFAALLDGLPGLFRVCEYRFNSKRIQADAPEASLPNMLDIPADLLIREVKA
jgi:GNAT superfamily N-acetyltransferase